MMKVYKLLNWLSQNDIKFTIKDQDNNDGDVLITIDDYMFITIDGGHQVNIVDEFGIETGFEIDDLNIIFNIINFHSNK